MPPLLDRPVTVLDCWTYPISVGYPSDVRLVGSTPFDNRQVDGIRIAVWLFLVEAAHEAPVWSLPIRVCGKVSPTCTILVIQPLLFCIGTTTRTYCYMVYYPPVPEQDVQSIQEGRMEQGQVNPLVGYRNPRHLAPSLLRL